MKGANWISSSFGQLGEVPVDVKKSKTRWTADKKQNFKENHHCSTEKQSRSSQSPSDVAWIDKYKPLNENDLVVHKKKIAEVRRWLLERLSSSCKKNDSKILLLSGPAGTGKTATVDVLSKELNVELQEWNNPFSLTNDEYSSWRSSGSSFLESQRKQFHDFLLRANKYPSLSMHAERQDNTTQNHKIILIEEIPNLFQTNVKDFHDILRMFQSMSRNPLIFIISDTFAGESNLYSLFPKRFQLELGITCINFNPVALTSLTKVMTKILSIESSLQNRMKFEIPTKDVIDLLASGSSGDIRTCINSLQFYCTNVYHASKTDDTPSEVKKQAKKSHRKKTKLEEEKKNEDNSTEKFFSRDTSLLLFRALGKIFHCKREMLSKDEKAKQLPTHLHAKTRDKLMVNPEAVIDKIHMTNDTFNLYLHQNYTYFYDDIDDATDAANSLSDADFVTSQWSTRDVMRDYSSCLAARGLIFANKKRLNQSSTNTKWRPLYKPHWFEVIKKISCNRKTAEELFLDLRYPTLEVFKDVLPFLAKTCVPLRTPSHISFIQMISHYQLQNIPQSTSSAQLRENVNEPEDSEQQDIDPNLGPIARKTGSELVILSQEKCSADEMDAFEENLIEDFSDEDDMFLL